MSEYEVIEEETIGNEIVQLCSAYSSVGTAYFVVIIDKYGEEQERQQSGVPGCSINMRKKD